ncbi:hypothetical protein [Flavitalea sp.]
MQNPGKFDTKISSWLITPSDPRIRLVDSNSWYTAISVTQFSSFSWDWQYLP